MMAGAASAGRVDAAVAAPARRRINGVTTALAILTIGLVLCAAPALVLAQTPAEPPDAPETLATPKLTVRAFGDVQWGATRQRETPNSFALGQVDLFATSTLTERLSVLAEVVLEGGTSTRVVTDLERLQLTYRFNDHLQISAGRYHTGVGFFNAAFHHGAFFQQAIGRPKVFEFEDEGGVLPVHDVGLTVRGTVPGSRSTFTYLVETGNGRTWTADAEETPNRDQNAAKSLNVGVAYRPERWRGLELGSTYYRDTVAQGSGRSVAHRIAAGYVAYRTPKVEILAEWLSLTHRAPGERGHRNNVGYAQASKAWGRIRPYYRYDRLVLDEGTPLIGGFGSIIAHTAGVRIDTSQWVGIKAQYERTNDARQRRVDSLRTQLVFVF